MLAGSARGVGRHAFMHCILDAREASASDDGFPTHRIEKSPETSHREALLYFRIGLIFFN